MFIYYRHIVFMLAVVLLLACGAGPSCAEQSKEGLAQLQGIAREWDDAYKLASQTPRAALSGQIASLQSIRRKAQDLALPDCASLAKTALVDSMDNSINGFIAFLGQKPETEVQALFKKANESMQAFGNAVITISATPAP